MAKRVVTMTIDEDVYLHFRVVERINISNVVNDFLKNMMHVKTENLDEQKILLEIEEAKQMEEEILQKKMTLTSQLAKVKADNEEKSKEQREKNDFMHKTIRASGMMRDLI